MVYLIASVAFTLYTLGLVKAWQTREQHARNTTSTWMVVLGLIAHTGVTHLVLFGEHGTQLSLPYVINLVTLMIIIVVTLAGFRLPIDRLLILVLPLGMGAVVMAVLVKPGIDPTSDSTVTGTLLVHVLFSLAAYTALMLAACQSILLALLDRQLKNPQKPSIQWLPPLDTMEALLISMLWIGWLLLTGSIASGYLFLEDMFAQRVSHHTVITTLSWCVYSFFLGGRYFFGWRGLTAVRWTLVGFTLLVIGYLGSKFVLEYLLQP